MSNFVLVVVVLGERLSNAGAYRHADFTLNRENGNIGRRRKQTSRKTKKRPARAIPRFGCQFQVELRELELN